MKLAGDFSTLLDAMALTPHSPVLIGIDGRPCSGKTALAGKLATHLGAETLYFDDFVLPKSRWPENITPHFPFPYMRYQEFETRVQKLKGIRLQNPFLSKEYLS